VNPETKKPWAMQNEDGRSEHRDHQSENWNVDSGGGCDGSAFRGDDVFLSASNPANNPNAAPAIVKAQFSGAKSS